MQLTTTPFTYNAWIVQIEDGCDGNAVFDRKMGLLSWYGEYEANIC